MLKQIEQVLEFHKAFKIPVATKPLEGVSKDVERLRLSLLIEEIEELHEALNNGDKIEAGDALTDILYVLLGSYISLGYAAKLEEMFDEVHSSNMSKLEDGVPLYREDGKILKGKDFFVPNLKPIIEE